MSNNRGIDRKFGVDTNWFLSVKNEVICKKMGARWNEQVTQVKLGWHRDTLYLMCGILFMNIWHESVNGTVWDNCEVLGMTECAQSFNEHWYENALMQYSMVCWTYVLWNILKKQK